jgi:hypothetical protein
VENEQTEREHSDRWFCPLMGWSGRAPAPPAIEAGKGGAKDREHAMSQTAQAAIAVIGIDIGKNSFHIVGHDERGAIVLRQKWSSFRLRNCQTGAANAGVRRGLRENETRWRFGLPGACEHW